VVFGVFLCQNLLLLSLECRMTTQAILHLLISEYGAALRLPTRNNQIAAHIAQETGLAQGTLLGILSGNTARINENTRRKLADSLSGFQAPQLKNSRHDAPSPA
jgi:hypothetical protein